MDKPISVGDLVQVVRGHVCDLGRVFLVAEVDTWRAGWRCRECGTETDDECIAASPDSSGRGGALVWWLKRIPPLEELESMRTEETLKETA